MTEEKKYKPIPVTKMHSNCEGCNVAMLSSTYETKEERDLLGKILDRIINEK